jgi:hypothetical protein
MKIAAFGFRRKTGKDTLCKFIQRHINISRRKIRVNVAGFADPIKKIAYDLYGWMGVKPGSYYEDHPEEKEAALIGLPSGCKNVRDLWILLGNKMREVIDPNIWVNALLKTDNCDILLIKDLRFENEIDHVLRNNGEVNRVDRPGTDGADGEADTVLMNETRWNNVYNNDGDRNKLHQLAIDIAERLVK